MSRQTTKIYTYNEYIKNPPWIEETHELINGEIVFMPPEGYNNLRIALLLLQTLAEVFGIERLSKGIGIVTGGSKVTSRIPDLVLFDERSTEELITNNVSIIDLDMFPPLLVVEVVSPGKENHDRDYRYKYSEYAARGIQHYWIFDPQVKSASFYQLVDGVYDLMTYGDRGMITTEHFHNIQINLDRFW